MTPQEFSWDQDGRVIRNSREPDNAGEDRTGVFVVHVVSATTNSFLAVVEESTDVAIVRRRRSVARSPEVVRRLACVWLDAVIAERKSSLPELWDTGELAPPDETA